MCLEQEQQEHKPRNLKKRKKKPSKSLSLRKIIWKWKFLNDKEEVSPLSLSLLNPPHFSFAMDFHVYCISRLIFMSSILVFFVGICLALLENPNLRSSSLANNSGQINSNSVLVALMDSYYTELVELVEKALLLQTLEETIDKHNITIFAPRNEALERDLDLECFTFKLFS